MEVKKRQKNGMRDKRGTEEGKKESKEGREGTKKEKRLLDIEGSK